MDRDERLALAVRAQVELALAHELADPEGEAARLEGGGAAPELREIDPHIAPLDAGRPPSGPGRRAVADARAAVAALRDAMAADGAGPVDDVESVCAWVGVDRAAFDLAVEQAVAMP